MSSEITLTQRYSGESQWDLNDLKPDWPAQVIRCILPCQNADTHEWLRKGTVTTLGELFEHLGTDHTAKAIYAFYRTCRLVGLKRKKDSRKPARPPGSANGSSRSSIRG